jgi:hypothetical protein
VVRVSAEGSDVRMDPLQSLLDIEDTKVLRTVLTQLSRVGIGEDALSGVEADKDNVLAGEIVAGKLHITAGTSDHSTSIHVDEDLFTSDKGRNDNETSRYAIACSANHRNAQQPLEIAWYPPRDDMSSAPIVDITNLEVIMRSHGPHSDSCHLHTLAQGKKEHCTYGQVLAGSIGRSPDIEVQAVLILAAVWSVADGLRAGGPVSSSVKNLSWLEWALGNRRLPSARLESVVVVN